MFTKLNGCVRLNLCILLVCFSAATLSAAPQLRLSTSAVGPVFVELGAAAPAQAINAFNIGSGSLNLSVTSSASWLTGTVGSLVACANGPVATCQPVSIAMNISGMTPGVYTGSLTLNDPNAIDSPQSVTVTVQVDGAPSTANLFVTPAGGPSPTATLAVNTGAVVKSSVKTSDNGGWLTFAVAGGGSYNFYTPYQLQVTAQPNQTGNYTGTVTLSGSPYAADNQTISVNLDVTTQPILAVTPLAYNVIQGAAAQTYNVGFQNIGMGTLSISSVSTNGGSWLSAQASNGGVSITVNPGSLTPGTYSGTLTLSSNAANTSVPIPIIANVTAQGGPLISFGGVVDNASFASGKAVGSGTIAAVFGSQFSAAGPAYASSVPLPTTLANVQVLVNGTAAPLFYVDANQADFQLPFGLTAGTAVIQVTSNGQAGNQVSFSVDSIAPRLFTLPQFGPAPDTSPWGIVINASDGTLALPSSLGIPAHPAHPGDIVTIYALGLGPVSPSVATGSGAPATTPLAQTVNPVTVYFGGGFLGNTTASASYAGLAPNFVGLYQINVTIPPGTPIGDIPVTIEMPGHSSNFVEMSIAASPATSM
jgi:uncharacterized protein (TIGR03437 family)